MIVLNLFGGPGTGKSTTMCGLFSYMKMMGHNVEIADEFAKQLTWSERWGDLKDQLYVFGKQQSKLRRIVDKVEFAITDSPVILSSYYARHHNCDVPVGFHDVVMYEHKRHNHVNVFLRRVKAYEQAGREQTEPEAKEIDIKLKHLLDDTGEHYVNIDAGWSAPADIYEYLILSDILQRTELHDKIHSQFKMINEIVKDQ